MSAEMRHRVAIYLVHAEPIVNAPRLVPESQSSGAVVRVHTSAEQQRSSACAEHSTRWRRCSVFSPGARTQAQRHGQLATNWPGAPRATCLAGRRRCGCHPRSWRRANPQSRSSLSHPRPPAAYLLAGSASGNDVARTMAVTAAARVATATAAAAMGEEAAGRVAEAADAWDVEVERAADGKVAQARAEAVGRAREAVAVAVVVVVPRAAARKEAVARASAARGSQPRRRKSESRQELLP
jgi:hypothetical protein